MGNPDIRRYEQELGRATQGFRRRKRVLQTFRISLKLLLEEVDSPTYEDLERAFGPPEQMARDLIGAIPNLPSPFRRRQKIAIFISICLIVVVVSAGAFCVHNMPESGVEISDVMQYTEQGLYSDYVPGFDTAFSQNDFSWKQGKEYDGYLLLLENNAQADTKITVKYSKYQSPRCLVVPAGEQRVLQVEKAQSTEHTVSFSSSDGAVNGTIQVFLHLPS